MCEASRVDSTAAHSLLAHADHPVSAPLSDASVRGLLDRSVLGRARAVLDLGCGQGAWLLAALAADRELRAVGVDISSSALERAAEEAERLGSRDRLELHHTDARSYRSDELFDTVFCVGASHAFGGLLPALAAARSHLSPDGCLLFGDCFWEREPDAAALDALGAAREDFTDLAGTVDRVLADGWVPVHGHTSTPEEWDAYEWSWTGSLARWALDHPGDPRGAEFLQLAAAHRAQWLHGYRGTLGFVTLALRPAAAVHRA